MNRIKSAGRERIDRPLQGGLLGRLRQVWVSIPRSWLVSYLAVLLLPMLVSQTFYIYAKDMAIQNAAGACEIALEQTTATVGRLLGEIRGTGLELLTRQEVASLQYAETVTDIKKLKIAQLRKEIALKLNFSGYIQRAALYFPHCGASVSSNGYFDSPGRLDAELGREWGLALAEVEAWAAGKGDFKLFTRGDGQQLYAVMTTSTSGEPDTILMFQLDSGQFSALFSSAGEETAPVIWGESPDGAMLAAPGMEEETAAIYSLCKPYLESGETGRALDEQALVLCQAEAGYGWTVCSATSTAAWAAEMKAIRTAYFGYLAVCLVAGGAASVLLTQRNFSPVKRLVERLQKSAGEEVSGFDGLERNLNRLLQREQAVERQLRLKEQSLLPAALAGLMKGTTAGRQGYLDAVKEYGLQFAGGRFGIAGIWIADYSDLFFDGSAREDEKALELAQYVVTQVTEELVREAYPAYICGIDGRLYALYTPDGRPEASADRMAGICGRAENYIRTRLGIRVHFYLTALYGGGTDEPAAIRAAYEEAAWGLEQMEGFGVQDPVAFKRTLSWEDTPLGQLDKPDFSALSLLRRQYLCAVGAGELDEADRLYRTLRSQGVFQSERSFSAVRAQTLVLLDLLATGLLSPRKLAESGGALSELSARMSSARDIGTLDALTREAEETVWRLSREKEGPAESSYGDKVDQYIDEQFADSELTVGQIAEHFGVSASYLLRAYKKDREGCGISDSIHRRRVEEAKILLRTTADTVSDIAGKVGYGNALALIRAFKRLEGETPTAYRKDEG